MILLLVPVLALCAQGAQNAPPRRPLTVADALFQIPGVTGRIRRVPDCDGDGLDDLVAERGGKYYAPELIELVSSKGGKSIRVLWKREKGEPFPADWDAGSDVDGDRVPDLVLGFPDRGPGVVEVRSGKDASLLRRVEGVEATDRMGRSVLFVHDTNHDGVDDFVCAATEAPEALADEKKEVASQYGEGGENWVRFTDGTRTTVSAWIRRRLCSRSSRAGRISLRSGKDGTELWSLHGRVAGIGFGTILRDVGDLDRDGARDLLVQCDRRSSEPARVYSGSTHAPILSLETRLGPVSGMGDLDGDGVPDLSLDAMTIEYEDRMGSVRFVSGSTGKALFELQYPDWSEYGVTSAMGDLDGDGIADIGLGEPNYNLLAPGNPGYQPGHGVDLAKLTLDGALKLESLPWCAFTWESGVAWIHSGRTRQVILGVWALPGTRKGLGLALLPMPDLSGDGRPDVLVTDMDTAYVFAGPEPAPKAK